jgi:transposase
MTKRKTHAKTGQLVVERNFLANASVQVLGTRGKKWWARSMS